MTDLPAGLDAMTTFGSAVEFGRQAADAEGAGYPPNLDWDMKSRAFKFARPNPVQEMEVINFHRVLEQFMAGTGVPT